jgi:hypothetical protein
MIWSLAGLVLAAGIAVVAWYRSRNQGGFYDAHVYGMTPASHRRYGLVSLAFVAYFALTLVWHWETAGIAGLALYALIAVFYATSFLRGFADDDQ